MYPGVILAGGSARRLGGNGKAFIDALNAGVEVICIDTTLNTSEINIGKKIKLLNN